MARGARHHSYCCFRLCDKSAVQSPASFGDAAVRHGRAPLARMIAWVCANVIRVSMSQNCSQVPISRQTKAQPRKRAHPSSVSKRRRPSLTGTPCSTFVLHADDLGSLDVNSPVYYRRIQVGRIASYQLDADGQRVTMQIFVDAPYDRFVTGAPASGTRAAPIFRSTRRDSRSIRNRWRRCSREQPHFTNADLPIDKRDILRFVAPARLH